jgi:hypothetical protein
MSRPEGFQICPRCGKNSLPRIQPDSQANAMATSATLPTLNPSTCCVEDSPASPSASPADVSGNLTNDGSGLSLHESFAFYGPGGFSSRTYPDSSPATGMNWQTRQTSLFGNRECQMYSGSWPAAGMTRNGIAYRLPRSVPRISVTGPLSLPTLRSSERGSYQRDREREGERLTLMGRVKFRTLNARDGTARASDPEKRIAQGHQPGLHDQIRFPPTLHGSDGKSGAQRQKKRGMGGSHHGGNLAGFLPTLQAHDSVKGNAKRFRKDGTKHGAANLKMKSADSDGGPLNPAWCEWYMGFPIGWTELEDSETPSSRKSRNSSVGASSKRKRP